MEELLINSRVLILGASSSIGKALYTRLGPERSLGTFNRTAPPDKYSRHFDISNMNLSQLLTGTEKFSYAVLLLGIAKPDLCFEDQEGSREVNVTRMQRLIDEICERGIVPVFASSESVFNGRKGSYREEDTPSPILEYGRQKATVEAYLHKKDCPHIIMRIGRVFGSSPGDGTLFTSWFEDLHENRDIKCAFDNCFTPIHIEETVAGILRLMQHGCRGIYHLCGNESGSSCGMLSKLLMFYNKNYSKYNGHLIKQHLNDFPVKETRPLDISMRNDRIVNDTGMEFNPLEHWFNKIAANFRNA